MATAAPGTLNVFKTFSTYASKSLGTGCAVATEQIIKIIMTVIALIATSFQWNYFSLILI
jgi:hypothetical protein